MMALTDRAMGSGSEEKATYGTLRAGVVDTTKGFTVDEAIEHIGFGWIQIWIGLLAGFSWMADGMEIMVLSILGTVLVCEWNIRPTQEAFITTVVFIGFLIGSPVFGSWADKYGRRKVLLMSAVWVLYFGLLTATVPTMPWLLVIRMLVGFGIGAGSQAVTYYGEFLPCNVRGKLIVLVEVYWASGSAVEAILALLLMDYGWRVWLVATASPVLLFIIFATMLPTSPRFDLVCGRVTEARKTLEMLAKSNGKTLPPGELLPETVDKRGQPKDLLKPGVRKTSILLAIVWFCSAFLYYGLILFTTIFIQHGNTCTTVETTELSRLSKSEFTCSLNCQTLTTSDYVQLIWTSLAELPGIVLTIILIDKLGRKKMLIVQCLVFSVCCACLNICMNRTPMLFLLIVCRAATSTILQTLYVYTPEVYPTEIRALSLGVGSGFARAGAIVTPYIANVLLQWSQHAGLAIYTSLGLVAAVSAFLLPIETSGKAMAASAVG